MAKNKIKKHKYHAEYNRRFTLFICKPFARSLGRQGRQTMCDYALANKKLSLGVLVSTMMATIMDVGNIGLSVAYTSRDLHHFFFQGVLP